MLQARAGVCPALGGRKRARGDAEGGVGGPALPAAGPLKSPRFEAAARSEFVRSFRAVLERRAAARQEVSELEWQIKDLEEKYFDRFGRVGNALRGYQGFLKPGVDIRKPDSLKRFEPKPEDRLFSPSSSTLAGK